MFWYQCQLALRSIRKTPILSAVMIFTLATGVACTVICYTNYYHLKKNPLADKDQSLFLLQTDSWDEKHEYSGTPNHMPPLHSYRDTTALLASDIPLRQTAITKWGGAMHNPDSDQKAIYVRGNIVTRDFFPMFNLEFIYGAPWPQEADQHFQNVIVISEGINQKLFNGANSLGKTLVYESVQYQIIGVTRHQNNVNPTYDIAQVRWPSPEPQFYFPFATLTANEVGAWVNYQCPEDLRDYGSHWYQQRLKNSCTWISLWYEFSNSEQKIRFEDFVRNYINDQKKLGNYPRPLRFSLNSIGGYMELNQANYTNDQNTIYIGFFTFVVCTLNFVALLLAKFMRTITESGVRRALGASRHAIFAQHLIESCMLGGMAALLGMLMTYGGLLCLKLAMKSIPAAKNELAGANNLGLLEPDGSLLVICVSGALVASLIAGIYPAWRACVVPAANYLKVQ